jgi:pimeloyl-ACP methyl ester carboxylesterase
VVSWAHGTLGSADVCAPSRDTVDAAAHIFNQAPHILLNGLVRQGWAVVMTDYEGLGTPGPHPYLLGQSQARGILDIVRAARALHPELSSTVALVGHSQGGQAVLFAAHHRDWTPEVRVCGVAAIAPPSQIKTLLVNGAAWPQPDPGFAFTPLFLTGAIAGDPSIDPAQVLSDEAYALWPHAEIRCRVGLSQVDSWGGLTGTHQLRQPPTTSTTRFLAQLDSMHPDVDISVPIRISQAVLDQRVRVAFTRTLVEQLSLRNGGQNVSYVEYPTVSTTAYPDQLGYHFGTIETDAPALISWLTDRFAAAG